MSNGIRAGGSAGRLSIDVVAEVARLEADMAKIRRVVKDASGDIAKSAKAANDNLATMGNGLRAANDNMAKTAPSAKMAAFGMRNLAFQAQDLGVQLTQAAASGEPLKMTLMALVMQGPQIRDAINQTGKSVFQLAAGFATAHPILLAVVAALGVAYGAISLFAGEIDKSGELDRYAASLGLTKEEMEKLGDVSVTTGDVFKGLWRTIDQGLGASKVFAAIKSWAVDTFKTALTWAQNFAAGAYAVIAGTSRIIGTLATAAKQVLQGDFAGALTTVVTGRVADAYATAFQEAKKAMAGFGADVARNTMDVAKERIGAKAREIIDDRAEKKMKDKAKETGSLLADVMSGAFLANFAAKMQAHPIVKVDWAGPTDLDSRMDEIEEQQRAKDRLKESQDYMDQRARERFVRGAQQFADIIGGKFGRIIGEFASLFDRVLPDLTKSLGESLGGLGDKISGLLKGAGIGATAAGITGGSAMGGALGGALGQGLGNMVAPMLGQLGAFAGPIGAIAGGILGGVVGGLFKKVKKASATIEIMAGEAAQTSLTGNSAKLKKTAGAMADSLIGGLSSIADQLGGMLGDGIKVSIGQRDKTFRVDLQGLGRTKNMPKFDTQEEAVAFAIQEVIKQGAIVGLRAGTAVLLKGEGDLEAQLQKALRFENVFKDLAQRANPTIASLDAIAKEFDQLIDIFEEAKASTEDYAKLQELMSIRQREVIEQAFEPIRSMLDDLKGKADAAGEAVRTAFDAVLQREADAVAAYNEAVTKARRAGQQRWLDIVTTGYNEEVDRLKGTLDTVSGGIDEMRRSADDFRQVASKLADFVKSVNEDLGSGSISGMRDEFDRVASAARAGDLAAMTALPEIGARYRDAVKASATDSVSMVRELARIAAAAGDAGSVAGARASAADAAVEAAQAQIDGINRQIEAVKEQIEVAKAQLEKTDDVVESGKSIQDLLADMQSATQAADLARDQMAKLGELQQTELTFGEAVAGYEAAKKDRDDLIRDITAAGFADLITVQQQTGAQMVASLSAAAQQAAKASADAAAAIDAAQKAQAAAEAAANDNMAWQSWMGQIPFFAAGGDHDGGLRIVGENGPELEATGPSRILNDRQIAAALGGNGDAAAAEIRGLREDLDAVLYQIAKNTGKTSDQLRRWDGDGMPEERNVA